MTRSSIDLFHKINDYSSKRVARLDILNYSHHDTSLSIHWMIFIQCPQLSLVRAIFVEMGHVSTELAVME